MCNGFLFSLRVPRELIKVSWDSVCTSKEYGGLDHDSVPGTKCLDLDLSGYSSRHLVFCGFHG